MDTRRLAIVEVLFSAHSNVRHSMGFAIIDKRYDSEYMGVYQEIVDQIVKHLGFTGLKDYAKAFAIGSLENSTMNKYYNVYENNYEDIESLICGEQIVIYTYNDIQRGEPIAKNLLFTIKIRAKHPNNNSYMFPISMADVKKTVGCKRMPKKDLWFCTDWKEP